MLMKASVIFFILNSNIISDCTPSLQLALDSTVSRLMGLQRALDTIDGNTIFSPLATNFPLAKLALGATGETKQELLKALAVASHDQIKPYVRNVTRRLKRLRGVDITILSKIYVSKDEQIEPEFERESKDIFNSTFEKLDFKNKRPMDIVWHINNWIRRQTNSTLITLLQPGDITMSHDPSFQPSLIVVTAVHFRGFWNKHFKLERPGNFYSPKGNQTVPMMYVAAKFLYWHSSVLDAEIIIIPYSENAFAASFIIVLPKSRTGLPKLLKDLHNGHQKINNELKKLQFRSIKVTMPKFRIIMKNNLATLFRKVNTYKIFDPHNKNMDKFVKNKKLHVTGGFEEIVFEISETGTSVTGTGLPLSADQEYEFHVRVDHPFLFYVQTAGQQLFFGTFNDVQKQLLLGNFNDTSKP